MFTVYKLNSDNFEDTLVTKEAYKYIVPSMSTGDWHTHTKSVVKVRSLKNVITLEQLQEEDGFNDSICHACGGAI